jgi:hypothetical protein
MNLWTISFELQENRIINGIAGIRKESLVKANVTVAADSEMEAYEKMQAVIDSIRPQRVVMNMESE